MRIDASFTSVARTLGFWTSFVLELDARNAASVGGMLIEKLLLLMFERPRKVVVLPVVVEDWPLFVVVVVAPLNVTATGFDIEATGGNMPSSRSVLRSTSRSIASTNTSGFA